MKNQFHWNKKSPKDAFLIPEDGFEALITKQAASKARVSRRRRLYSTIFSTAIIGGLLSYYLIFDKPNEEVTNLDRFESLLINYPLAPAIASVNIPTIKKERKNNRVHNPIITKEKNKKSIAPKAKSAENNPSIKDNELTVFTKAIPIDGFNSFNNFLSRKIDSVLQVNDTIMNKRITVQFEINELGNAQNVYIKNLDSPFLIDGITEIMLRSPKWKPATANGVAITSKFAIPLTLNFQKQIIKEDDESN